VIIMTTKATALSLRMALHSSLGPEVATIGVGVCSLTHESRHSPTRSAGTLCADFVAEVGDQKSEGFGAIS